MKIVLKTVAMVTIIAAAMGAYFNCNNRTD